MEIFPDHCRGLLLSLNLNIYCHNCQTAAYYPVYDKKHLQKHKFKKSTVWHSWAQFPFPGTGTFLTKRSQLKDSTPAFKFVRSQLQIPMQETYNLTNIFVIHTVPARKRRQDL